MRILLHLGIAETSLIYDKNYLVFIIYMDINNYKSGVSVLVPTRGRNDMLVESVRTIFGKHNVGIEVIIGLDNDDDADGVVRYLMAEYGDVIKPMVFRPLGYGNLHLYYNAMALSAEYMWLFIWNDDAIMMTENWTDIVLGNNNRNMLAPYPTKISNRKNTKTLFPIVPKWWVDILGRLSLHCATDTWLEYVASEAKLFKRVDIDIHHERPDDITSVNAVPVGNFHSKEMKRLRTEDAKCLRSALLR